MNLAAETLTLQLSGLDIALLVIYFAFVLGIGFALQRAVTSSVGLLPVRPVAAGVDYRDRVHLSANIGAIEILGQSASGAQYGSRSCTTTGSAPSPR